MDVKKKVLVGGCFDILHFGHVRFFKEAKKHGNYLVIALESDENTKKLKGPNRPIHTQKQRREILESLNFVDEVISLPEMKSDEDYNNLVARVRPFAIALTEGDPILSKKKILAKTIGAKLIVIKKCANFSSTKLAKLINLE